MERHIRSLIQTHTLSTMYPERDHETVVYCSAHFFNIGTWPQDDAPWTRYFRAALRAEHSE